MKSFILKMDDATHTFYKVKAAKEGKSIQKLINEILDRNAQDKTDDTR